MEQGGGTTQTVLSKVLKWPQGILKIIEIAAAACSLISVAAAGWYAFSGSGLVYFTAVGSMVYAVLYLIITVTGMEDRIHICSLYGVLSFPLFDLIDSIVSAALFALCFILACVGASDSSANGAAAFFCIVAAVAWAYSAYIAYRYWQDWKDRQTLQSPPGGYPPASDHPAAYPPPPYPGSTNPTDPKKF